jgi:hypothetical protein
VVQHHPGSALTARAAVASGDRRAHRPGRSLAALRDGTHQAGDVDGALHRDPRGGPARVPDVPSGPAQPCASAREGAWPARGREDLLQVRGCLAGGQPQAQHRDPPGVLQQAGGHQADHHRDRSRTVGERALHRVRALRHGVRRLHGGHLLPAEALPPHPHGDLRRRGHRLAVNPHQRRPSRARHGSRVARQPRYRDLRGGRRCCYAR